MIYIIIIFIILCKEHIKVKIFFVRNILYIWVFQYLFQPMSKIITITGDLGSGKSTISNILCKKLGFEYVYTGMIHRKIAERHGMNAFELNKYAEEHPEIDDEIDSTFKTLDKAHKNYIVDSRLAWFFIENSFKIYLRTNLTVAAKRIFNDSKRFNEKYKTEKDALKSIIQRKKSEDKRYFKKYKADCGNMNNFDLVLDTSFLTPEQIADFIIEKYEKEKSISSNERRG